MSCFECGKNIRLGEFKLSPEALSYFTYDGNEILTFRNQLGEAIILKPKEDKMDTRSFATANVLCHSGPIDRQVEYYDTRLLQHTLIDSLDNYLIFLRLHTVSIKNRNTGEYAFYDLFRASARSKPGIRIWSLSKIAATQSGKLTDNYQKIVEKPESTFFVEDTVLYSQNFENVYYTISPENGKLFYTKSNGIVAVEWTENDYMVLEE